MQGDSFRVDYFVIIGRTRIATRTRFLGFFGGLEFGSWSCYVYMPFGLLLCI